MAWHWPGVLNRPRLTDHGPSALREAAVDIVEHGIRAADPYRATRALVALEGDRLRVGPLDYDMRDWDHIYAIGAGKATQPIAQALETVLGERLTEAAVILKRGEAQTLRRIRVIEAAHPVPDEESYRGAQEIVRLARRAGRRDLVFAAITGGSSALMIWPPEGVSLADKQALNEILLKSGASIREINAVRKHVSCIKGGRLAQEIFPATLINLTVSDVVGDPLDYITDLTVPDTSTYEDAWRTLDKYELWERLPAPVRAHLRRGAEIETPKAFSRTYHTFVVVPGDAACLGAARRCEELGFETHLVTNAMEGESRDEASAFVAGACEIGSSVPGGPPRAFVAGGETAVTLHGEDHGEGGPNQEFALSAALAVAGRTGVVAAAVDVDGSDGPTGAAGGLVDGDTVSRARAAGFDPVESLRRHATRELLEATGDLVITGPTGTNVNDLMFMLAGP